MHVKSTVGNHSTFLESAFFPIMFNNKAAEGYQKLSSRQREYGKRLIESEVKPCQGAAILDLGCGTGELSAYLAELVGQKGNVLGVDPDIQRLKLAQESHKRIENLKFVEGSTSNFPGMGSETYDIVYSHAVFHWVPDKEEAFKNVFSSLKPAGKIVMLYCDRLLTTFDRIFRELNPENLDRLLNMFQAKTRPVVEQICTDAGFKVLKSYDIESSDRVFENGDSLRSYCWAMTHGVFDPELATEDRLARFCALYSSGEAGEIKLPPGENDLYSVLVAVKSAKN